MFILVNTFIIKTILVIKFFKSYKHYDTKQCPNCGGKTYDSARDYLAYKVLLDVINSQVGLVEGHTAAVW